MNSVYSNFNYSKEYSDPNNNSRLLFHKLFKLAINMTIIKRIFTKIDYQ